MFEASLIEILAADTDLTNLLSTFSGDPAIFSSIAPQKATRPYIVFDIDESISTNLPVKTFDIVLDVYDRQQSGVNLRKIAERIEFILDTREIKDDPRFNTIRFYWEDSREVENTDIKIRHRVCRVTARAGRQKWTEQL